METSNERVEPDDRAEVKLDGVEPKRYVLVTVDEDGDDFLITTRSRGLSIRELTSTLAHAFGSARADAEREMYEAIRDVVFAEGGPVSDGAVLGTPECTDPDCFHEDDPFRHSRSTPGEA